MHKGPRKVLLATPLLLAGLPALSFGQTPQAPKKLPAGPAAPQSTHYPIFILAFGNDPNWSLRIGLKGPERMDRPGYPPIPLEAADVTHEAAADSWTYHAKDSATGAAVAIHLTREACTDAKNDTLTLTPPPSGKYSFRASVEHAQLGSMTGCGRIAAELFPRINNQPDQEEEDDAKKKPPVPASSVTSFKSPVSAAYLNLAGKIVFKRGATNHLIGSEGSQLAVSHDGKRLLYTHEDKPEDRAIFLYDFATEKSTELVRGQVQQAFWSLDDARFAFMKFVDGKWHLWSAPIASPETAASVFPGDIVAIHGWVDTQTILVDDLQQLSWVTDTGTIQQAIPEKDILGDAFGSSSAGTFRVHPLNPDLLLVSAEWLKPPASVPSDTHTGGSFGFFLYEIRSKRRTLLCPLNMLSQNAEWSRDGFQIFFTGADSARRYATYHMFWDGIGLQKYVSGTSLAIGQ
ncbi:MAG: hypothetical protein AUH11_11515 [Acidobacteria bacterium 13_2_20CM_57_17]|nr:MAG: hypothetical protein AUH11_11515 [Acidobacteria bacterium 13_2_20CM_57_17]